MSPVPVQTPVSPPSSTCDPGPAASPVSAPDISTSLKTTVEGKDGLPQPPAAAEKDEKEEKQQPEPAIQEQEQPPDSVHKPPDGTKDSGILGKSTLQT